MATKNGDLTIYADGSVRKNGDGGFGYIILEDGKEDIVGSSWAYNTTNNRMELEGVIQALSKVEVRPRKITIWSDSQYVIKAFTDGWLAKWKRNYWINNGAVVKNSDLWQCLDATVWHLESHGVVFDWQWCRGHNGDHYNEIVDKLAQAASASAKDFR